MRKSLIGRKKTAVPARKSNRIQISKSGRTDRAALLSVERLRAGYGEMPVLHDVSLDIREREMVALVGSNGAGKTTLLRALSRILPATGSIVLKGRDLMDLTPDQVFALGLVQVPEGRQLFGRMTVQDNLLMGSYRRRDNGAVARDLERIYAMFVPLAKRRRQLAGSMSGGEQQMCAMARALMASPILMVIDEMSLGLAPVVVEQDVQLALSYADRAYVMETGRIVHQGRASDLIDDPAVQQAYLGL